MAIWMAQEWVAGRPAKNPVKVIVVADDRGEAQTRAQLVIDQETDADRYRRVRHVLIAEIIELAEDRLREEEVRAMKFGGYMEFPDA